MLKDYVGIKWIKAEPCDAGSARAKKFLRDDKIDPNLEGYKVVYANGYVSWSPKDVFEEAYFSSGKMPFSAALEALKLGKCVTRGTWHEGEKLFIVSASEFIVNRKPLNEILDEGTKVKYAAHIDKISIGGEVSTYVVTNEDLLANDWMIEED